MNETIEETAKLVNAFIDQYWNPDITVRDWWQRLADNRLLNTTLPVEAGGRSWTTAQATAANNVLTDRRVVGPPSGLGMMLAAPTIAKHGTPDQVTEWLPPILNGTESWCQLFSEPGSGSDLAGLRTQAVRDGDEWVITGQKVWTSMGAEADWGLLIARTNPDLPKHQGITYFGFPMKQPGVEVRPLTEMTGRAIFNEVFIEEARVHNDHLLGGLGNGWKVANSTLTFERASIGASHAGGVGTASPGVLAGHLDQPVGTFLGKRDGLTVSTVGRRVLNLLHDHAERNDVAADATVRQDLAQLHILHRIAGLTGARRSAERKPPAALGAGVDGNLAKLLNTEQLKLARKLAGSILGPDAGLVGEGAATEGFLQELILFSPAPSIYGGTDEIQRNIIGERGLGLPKEPGPSRDTPFSDLPK